MLVLARKKRERVTLKHVKTGEVIELSISDIRPQQVRLGIDASQDWKISRNEILPQEQEQRAA